MDWINKLSYNTHLFIFLSRYGLSGLEDALVLYENMQQEYVCTTKTSTSRIKIGDLYYLEIHGHNIIAHTAQNQYRKYGTLTHELQALALYGFIRCSQSCIVSMSKIKSIDGHEIILTNDEKLHLSRNCAPKVILAFHNFVHNQKKT